MASPQAWYRLFLSTRSIPPPELQAVSQGPTECYALSIKMAEFKELPPGSYQVQLCFYDTILKQFFGRSFSTETISTSNNRIPIEESVFFHSPLKEERIVIVAEIVVISPGEDPYTLCWTTIPVFTSSMPMTDFSTNTAYPFQFKKYQLYKGSPFMLLYIDALTPNNTSVQRADGVLECVMQTHQNFGVAINYIPEFVIVSEDEQVPGLRPAQQDSCLNFAPEENDNFIAILDNLSVHFGVVPERVEYTILELLNRERHYYFNKAPEDPCIANLSIVERRLRIGIHNGYTFIEEPIIQVLVAQDGTDTTPKLRRRSRSFSRLGTAVDSSDFAALRVQNSIRLLKLIPDPQVAVIFSLEYIFGVVGRDTVTDTQVVNVCWGAWVPYYDGAFTISDTVTVSLVGGPRPNPDNALYFKNMLRLRQDEVDPFANAKPTITLHFNFAIVGSVNTEAGSAAEYSHFTQHAGPTPLPLPDLPPERSQLEDTRDPGADDNEHEPSSSALSSTRPVVVTSPAVRKSPDLLAPTQVHSNLRRGTGFSESTPHDAQPIEADTSSLRPKSFSRSVLLALEKLPFSSMYNDPGPPPTIVDPNKPTRTINLQAELADTRQDTNVIVIHFLAITLLRNSLLDFSKRSYRVFFVLRFYRFETVSTERLAVVPPPIEWTTRAAGSSFLLKRINEDNHFLDDENYGFMIRFIVDRDVEDLFAYFSTCPLFIDVFDADSMVHIGMTEIPLRELCRQGAPSVQMNLQCPVRQIGISDTGDEATAIMYVKLANFGCSSRHESGINQAASKSIVSKRLLRLGESRFGSIKVKARPLSSIHDSALQRFMTAQHLDISQRKEELFGGENHERLKKWLHANGKDENDRSTAAKLKKFVFEEQLEAYKMLRNESKAAKLLRAVFDSITVSHTVYITKGQVEFFEFCLQNTFAERVTCHVDHTCEHIFPVVDMTEWKHFKTMNKLTTPLEDAVYRIEDGGKLLVDLQAMETLYLPVKLDITGAGESVEGNKVTQARVVFKRDDTHEPLAILELTLVIKSPAMGSHFRWFVEECTKVNKLIVLPNYGQRVISLRCDDPTVLLQLRNSSTSRQEILITCHSLESPFVKTFQLYLFSDRFYSRLQSTWEIFIHSSQKLTVEGIQGQLTKIPLHLPTEAKTTSQLSSNAVVQFHSASTCLSIPTEHAFTPRPQTGPPGSRAHFIPTFNGKRILFATAVDSQARKLLRSWLIHAYVSAPNIVKVYDVIVPWLENRPAKKKLPITNAYAEPRNYRIHTSNSTVLTVEEEYISLKPNETVPVTLVIKPIDTDKPVKIEVLIFVEDAELSQQEETYAINVSYGA